VRTSFLKLKRNSAAGIDGKTWKEYGKIPGDNLKNLSERLRKGAYRARAVKRTYIPKGDGRRRPKGSKADLTPFSHFKLKYKGVKNGRSKRIDETGKAEK